ncbi:DUF4411 family protein [Kordiimonas sp.]|uniref:DUF4411 family protein n=1 Tax=Kordiimonas sp. TaxID=1970157 RepID=UPI003A9141DA
MKKYCFDTSGISNPLETTPLDIYKTLWAQFEEVVLSGSIGVTAEIFEEMMHIDGEVGELLKKSKSSLICEVEEDWWDWPKYVEYSANLIVKYGEFISEYTGGSPKTICLNDMTNIALAGTLGIPVVSMEVSTAPSVTKKRIPDICAMEGVEHLMFNDFLRAEGLTF